jgi:spore coat protein A
MRNLSLNEIVAANVDIPVEADLGLYNSETGVPTPLKWGAPITENPQQGNIEDWMIHNFTEDAHPIHIHEVLFQLLGRRSLDPKTNLPTGELLPPEPTENGWKETVIAYPGQATCLRIDFTNAQNGQYVWHCHIVEHEDNEMMRPYAIGPLQHPLV